MSPLPPPSRQKGISLIEALVAIIVLSFGMLGILAAQMRSLTNTQDSARRLQAIRLIEDLGERIKVQPDAIGNAPLYTTNGWFDTSTALNAPDCISQSCVATDFAQFEISRWLDNVGQSLPLAQANVFTTSDDKQLGVMIAWRMNENNAATASALLPQATDNSNADIACPDERMCHLQYISLSQRCIPVNADNAYCAK